MSYYMNFLADEADKKGDDVVVALEGGKVEMRVDPKSLLYLFGLTLDYSDELIGGGYKVSFAPATVLLPVHLLSHCFFDNRRVGVGTASASSLSLLTGCSLIALQFINPNASSSCGCGSSFNV